MIVFMILQKDKIKSVILKGSMLRESSTFCSANNLLLEAVLNSKRAQ
jgi:hypothetical protein